MKGKKMCLGSKLESSPALQLAKYNFEKDPLICNQ
jgi:hypothetical protein